MASIKEKIGYGFGDMASSMFWKVFSYYLPFFYSNIFGLELVDAAMLVLVTRVWDAVSDPLMGIISDRTSSRWGKYRPYLLWVAAPFSICGILLFTTPDLSYSGKLIWAYVTYVLMMTVYTGINVPYGAMLGVISDKPHDKTVFSSFRMFFAYGGSFIALFSWDPLCNLFHNSFNVSPATSWQLAMVVIAAGCFILFLCCFLMTKERVKTSPTASMSSDFKALLSNSPWWLMIGASLCFNLFNTVRGGTAVYFFADVIGEDAHLSFGHWGNILFYSGLFLGVGEIANMIGVALTVPIAKAFGKKGTFIAVNLALVILSASFFCIPLSPAGYWMMLVAQIFISVLTGIMSPLIWSMYADVSDYAEWRYRSACTGLIFSSSSMAQKFGGAFGGAAVLWLLSQCGYSETAMGSEQPRQAIDCLWMLMSFIPAAVAALAAFVAFFYPLTAGQMDNIVTDLRQSRMVIQSDCPAEDSSTDFASL